MKQKWPIRVGLHVQGGCDLGQGGSLQLRQCLKRLPALPEPGESSLSLKGDLGGAFVCPPYLSIREALLLQFTQVISAPPSDLSVILTSSERDSQIPKHGWLLSNFPYFFSTILFIILIILNCD